MFPSHTKAKEHFVVFYFYVAHQMTSVVSPVTTFHRKTVTSLCDEVEQVVFCRIYLFERNLLMETGRKKLKLK